MSLNTKVRVLFDLALILWVLIAVTAISFILIQNIEYHVISSLRPA